jgi:hypothetical protein
MARTLTGSLAGALLVLVLAPAGAFAAPGPAVTVRVEGKTHTLLAPTTVQTHTGSITKSGAPQGVCSATSAAGALDTATHHNWAGSFSRSFGDYLIKTILGETQSTTSYYWAIWIDDRYATTGACGIKLHRGDRLLFAVDSVAHHEHPLALSASHTARVGHPLSVKVVWFSDAGVAKPLTGARVSGAGTNAVTDSHGVVLIVPRRRGTLVLRADRAGYIRAAPARVRVSG